MKMIFIACYYSKNMSNEWDSDNQREGGDWQTPLNINIKQISLYAKYINPLHLRRYTFFIWKMFVSIFDENFSLQRWQKLFLLFYPWPYEISFFIAKQNIIPSFKVCLVLLHLYYNCSIWGIDGLQAKKMLEYKIFLPLIIL